MKVKEWLNIIKPKTKKGDLIDIYAIERFDNGIVINHYVELPHDLERYPLLNEADILEQSEEIAPYTDGIGGASGTLTIYRAKIDLDQYRIAKGIKLKEPKTRRHFKL